MRRVTEGVDCSTFRFGPTGQILGTRERERERDMDGGTNYRFFCIHVRNVIAFVCGIELAVLLWLFILHNEYLFTICHTRTVHDNTTTAAAPIPNIRSPSQLTTREERACSVYSLVVIFTVFHVFCDCITLIGILIKRHHFVLPLIILLASNIAVSLIFLFNALITYMFSGAHSGYFLLFVVGQGIVRIYEFLCARKLYWFYRWAADERYMPQSSLLKPDEALPFQF